MCPSAPLPDVDFGSKICPFKPVPPHFSGLSFSHLSNYICLRRTRYLVNWPWWGKVVLIVCLNMLYTVNAHGYRKHLCNIESFCMYSFLSPHDQEHALCVHFPGVSSWEIRSRSHKKTPIKSSPQVLFQFNRLLVFNTKWSNPSKCFAYQSVLFSGIS